MFEPAQIAVEKRAQIIHSVFEHRQPIDPAPEREALPFVGIEPARGDHLGMHHPRAEHFQDRTSVVKGKSVSVRVDLGGRRIIKQKTKNKIKRSKNQRKEHTTKKN